MASEFKEIIAGKVSGGEGSVIQEIADIFVRENFSLNQGLGTLFALVADAVQREDSMNSVECTVGLCTITIVKDKVNKKDLDS